MEINSDSTDSINIEDITIEDQKYHDQWVQKEVSLNKQAKFKSEI
jgi:hypothetical protein